MLQRLLGAGWVSLLLGAAPALVACGAEANLPLENLGNTSDNLGGVVPPSASNLTGKARFNGRWVGQPREPFIDVEGVARPYVFPSGSRNVSLELEFDEDSFISGSLVFGGGTAPAPLAGVSYPPDLEYGLLDGTDVPVVEGFVYPLGAAAPELEEATDEIEHASFAAFGAFADWCALQPSFAMPDGRFQCVEGVGGWSGSLEEEGGYVCTSSGPDGVSLTVDCGLAALCSVEGACVCDAAGCTSNPGTNVISLRLDGDELYVGFAGTRVDVGLPTRLPEELNLVIMSRVTAP